MGDDRFSFPANIIAGKRRLVVDDMLMLRKHAFSDGIRTAAEVRLLLQIHRSCGTTCPEWDTYVIESLAFYTVHILHPRGWIDEANADWLIDTLSVNGEVHSPLELEAILHALETAQSAPEHLYAFVLKQMRIGLQPGARNAYALSRPSSASGIDIADLHYLWRVLRCACSEGRLVLSALERAQLQAIDVMADPSQHHPGWNALVELVLAGRGDAGEYRSGRWLKVGDDAMLDEKGQAA